MNPLDKESKLNLTLNQLIGIVFLTTCTATIIIVGFVKIYSKK